MKCIFYPTAFMPFKEDTLRYYNHLNHTNITMNEECLEFQVHNNYIMMQILTEIFKVFHWNV